MAHYVQCVYVCIVADGCGCVSQAMRVAVEYNPYVVGYLLEREVLAAPPEHVVRRGRSEALAYAATALPHWRRAPPALRLLAAVPVCAAPPATPRCADGELVAAPGAPPRRAGRAALLAGAALLAAAPVAHALHGLLTRL